jgi:hypothetical protein
VTVEKFLIFWDHNNIVIIEGLVALIIVTALFVAYRGFFSSKEDGDHSTGGGIDAAQLEKTLQKILEAQKSHGAGATRGSGEDMSVDITMDNGHGGGGVSGDAAQEIALMRKTLAERQQQIEALQVKAKEAAAAAELAAAGGGGGGGLSLDEQNNLNDKIRDLEARLSEYEIISEDIADLSKYRDENDKLKQELEALKAGGGSAPAAAAPAAPAAPVAPPAAAQPPPAAAAPTPAPAAAEPAAEVSSNVVDDDLMKEFAAAVGEPKESAVKSFISNADAAEALADSASTESVVDDDLMKEFEAAVAGQKLESAAEKAGTGDVAAVKTGDDTEKLMDEFQSFVTKKS